MKIAPYAVLTLMAFACTAPQGYHVVDETQLDPLLEARDEDAVGGLLTRGMNPVFGLVRAARVGSVPMVEYFLARKVDPNGSLDDGFNSTALMAGASGNHPAVIAPLIAAGADPDQTDALGDPAINWAAYMGNIEYARGLLAVGARTDLSSHHGNAFEIACRQGFGPLITLFGGEPTTGLGEEEVALVLTLLGDKITDAAEAVQLALAAGVSATLRTSAGIPVFAIAAERGELGAVRSLLEGGAQLDAIDPIGFTALTYAARGGAVEVLRALIEAGAKIDHPARDEGMGMTPLHMAAAKGRTAAVLALVELGANVDAVNTRGESALLWSITEGHAETALVLVGAGGNPDLIGDGGYTARQAAEDYGFTEVSAAISHSRDGDFGGA